MEPGQAGVKAILHINVEATGRKEGMHWRIREAPSPHDRAQRPAHHFEIRTSFPKGDPQLLEAARVHVVMGPIYPRRLAVPFPAGKQFQTMLSFEGHALELAHLSRQRDAVKLVLDVQAKPFTARG